MTTTYHQHCPLARTLEIVGERWTMLIARELLLGPRRFTDLMEGLPGISANVLTGRLKDLEQAGLVSRRALPPPAASTVYELTEDAGGLADVLAAMTRWGTSMLGRPRRGDVVRSEWLLLAEAVTSPAPEAIEGATFEVHSGDEIVHVEARDGRLHPRQGPAPHPTVVITARPTVLAEIASGALTVQAALDRDSVTVTGDKAAAGRFLDLLSGLSPSLT
jgi:DNA-binding HxlR family transcriptional regulator